MAVCVEVVLSLEGGERLPKIGVISAVDHAGREVGTIEQHLRLDQHWTTILAWIFQGRIIDGLRIERRSSTGRNGGCADEASQQDRFEQVTRHILKTALTSGWFRMLVGQL
jgi:hypothetical protein